MHIQYLGYITHMSVLQLASLLASRTFGWKENANKERAHSSSSVFIKISMNTFSNHWHFIIQVTFNNTSIAYTVYAKTFL
jgi:hypothetical protein